MEITQTPHNANRKDWQNWLKKNYKNEREIWLDCHKRGIGKLCIE